MVDDQGSGQCILTPEKCTAMYPNLENDHGKYCTRCNQDECLSWEETVCENAFVFNNREMKCKGCKEEFGDKTLTCNQDGATFCATNSFQTPVKFDENISNLHCIECSILIPQCSICLFADKCDQCKEEEYYKVSDDGKSC